MQIPGIIIDNDFFHTWHENLMQFVTNIGYWRLYASILAQFMYLICFPIFYLGEVRLTIESIAIDYFSF